MLGQLLKPSYNKPYFSLKAKKPLVWKHLKPQGLVLSIQYHKLLSSCCVCCLLRISSSCGLFCTKMMLCSVILKRFHPPPHGHGLHTRRESINFLPGCAKIFARRHFDACGKCRCVLAAAAGMCLLPAILLRRTLPTSATTPCGTCAAF